MIEKKHINIGSELVIGLNYLTLYDEFETNPTYIWHKSCMSRMRILSVTDFIL